MIPVDKERSDMTASIRLQRRTRNVIRLFSTSNNHTIHYRVEVAGNSIRYNKS